MSNISGESLSKYLRDKNATLQFVANNHRSISNFPKSDNGNILPAFK